MKKILIVDDIEDYTESLRNVLKNEYEIEVAHSLQEAKEKANDTFSLFLVDIRLNEADINNIDGLTFLTWSKENYGNIPIIIMSAYKEFEEQKNEILNKGAEAFLKKPIAIADLRNLIKKLT